MLNKLLLHITQQKLIFPFYHAVADKVTVHLKHLYKVRSSELFEKDLDYLLKYYEPISIDQLNDHIKGTKKIKKASFFLSFDDGLREFKELAWPILKKKGIPAALYVNPNFVDNKNLFFRFKASILIDYLQHNQDSKLLKEVNEVFGNMIDSMNNLETFVRGIKFAQSKFLDDLADCFNISFENYLKEKKPYLSTSELIDLQHDGVHIGAHSMNHPLFNELNDADKFQQLAASVNWVKEHLNPSLLTFTYPFTDYGIDGKFFSSVFASNDPKVDITFGTAGLKKERYKQHIQRIPIEDYSSGMADILKRQYLYYLAKAPLFKNTIKR